MTQLVLKSFGVNTDNYCVNGGKKLHSPGNLTVEGDWSNGAFFLAAKALGSDLEIKNLTLKVTAYHNAL